MNSNRARLYQVQRELASISQRNLSVTPYFTKLKTLWNEYESRCGSTDASNGIIEDQKVVQFLMGLNEKYNAVRGKILKMNPSPSLNDVYQLLLQEEQQRGVITDVKLNFRPVIGILSHPARMSKASYIAASYVRFVQSAGARVIPLIYNEPRDVLLKKLSLVNGVLFTGGWAKSGLYLEIVEEIFKKVLENNDAGQYFPCYAICLGFELLAMIISKDKSILERYAAKHQASTLHFVENADIDGTVFQRFPPELIEKLGTEKLAAQNHIYGISRDKLIGNTHLNDFFDVLTTSTDEKGKEYVSTVRARKYPITGFQWHPEKNAFEWGSLSIPHTEDAVQVTQQAANFFISEARKSLNMPLDSDLLNNLIYNYSTTYCGKDGYEFDEIYIFANYSKI